MPANDDSAAHASNWRTVLAVDALIGAIVSLVGVTVLLAVNGLVGAAMVAAGAGYAVLVGARARRWSRLRRSGLQ